MNLDELNKEELLDKLKKLTGGGLGTARTYNDFDELADRDENEVKDGYQLRFIGKDYARLQASHKTETVLVPDVAHNQADQNKDSQNLFITGDNLDALKHLENSYSGQVDVIYIDPPYNTGSDGFVYNDSFNFSDEDLKLKLGMSDSEVERVRNLSGKSSHSAWLTFMYPRLRIAKRLLKDTGVIFISIDDNEQANLKVLCDEIFGDTNFVADFIWKHRKSSQNDTDVSLSHNYTLCYARNRNNFKLIPLKIDEDKFANPDNDPRGPWVADPFDAPNIRPNLTYPVTNPLTGEQHLPPGGRHWRISREKFASALADNRVVWGKNGKGRPQLKRFLSEAISKGKNPFTIWDHVDTATNATKKMLDLFDGKKVFETPKPVGLIKEILNISMSSTGLVVDFFAGSGTTGDAVMQLNAEDGGSRKYILVQLDEDVASGSEAEKQGYKQIDEISRKRLELAADKILKEKGNELTADFDAGFKHYSLATTDATTLDKLDSFDPSAMLIDDMTTVFSGKDLGVNGGASGEETLLATWLVDDGYGFTDKIHALHFANATAYEIAGRLYILDKAWSKESTKELLNALGNNELRISSIVLYAYSFGFETLHELKVNIKTNVEDTIEIIERF